MTTGAGGDPVRPTGASRPANKVPLSMGYPYEGDNVYIDPKGNKPCRACKRRLADQQVQVGTATVVDTG